MAAGAVVTKAVLEYALLAGVPARRAVKRRRFRRICMVNPSSGIVRSDAAGSRGTWEFDGGAFMNEASDYVDLLDWLGRSGLAERDHGHVPAQLGGLAHHHWGKGETVRLGGMAVNEVQHWEFAEPDEDDARVEESSCAARLVYGHGHTG